MQGLSNELLVIIFSFLIVSCNQRKLIISENAIPIIEINNFNKVNFTHSKPPFGSEINIYKSQLDSVTILVDYNHSSDGFNDYFNEEEQTDQFEQLKYLDIDFLIPIRTQVDSSKIISENLIFRTWGSDRDSTKEKIFEFIYSETTQNTYLEVTLRKKYNEFNLLSIIDWIHAHKVKVINKD